MFWLFLAKSALKKNPSSGMTSGILIAIVLLFLMLGGLGCMTLLTSIIPSAGDVAKEVVAPAK